MQLKYRLSLAILATVAVSVCTLRAQADDDEDEEFGTFGFYARSPQNLSVALKMTQGPKVNFGNLGNVPVSLATTGDRIYQDGVVRIDQRRPASAGVQKELDADGQELYPEGGRYQVSFKDSSGTVINADYIAYDRRVTRDWAYVNPSQATRKDGYIGFDIYSARTQQGAFDANRGYTGGIELVLAHNLTDPKKRVSLNVTAGISLSGINTSKSGVVNSTLHTYTDYYRYNNPEADGVPPVFAGTDNPPGLTYQGPSYRTSTTDHTITETTTTISAKPDTTEETDTVDGAQVKGLWKLKGAYFTLKVGPQVSAMLTRSLGLSASVGVAGSYVGTSYTATESFTVDGIANPIAFPSESTSKNKFLPGYYANIDATWSLNDRTGLFAGVSYDNLGDYSQSVGGRTAKIDLSTTAGVRGGLSIKF